MLCIAYHPMTTLHGSQKYWFASNSYRKAFACSAFVFTPTSERAQTHEQYYIGMLTQGHCKLNLIKNIKRIEMTNTTRERRLLESTNALPLPIPEFRTA